MRDTSDPPRHSGRRSVALAIHLAYASREQEACRWSWHHGAHGTSAYTSSMNDWKSSVAWSKSFVASIIRTETSFFAG